MHPLEKSLRNKLERTVKEARDVAETAARAALEQLGVGEASPYSHLTDADKELRRKLRVHGRQLGDVRNATSEVQEISRLTEEVAYEHWHRMLFARFLAENNLLMFDGVAVTLEECEDLAADEGAANGWELAARCAARMLPQIFRIDSPVFQLSLPPEHELKLESLLTELPPEVFTASDSLGWVYQFWQAKKKDEVNASEKKIGARELPAVTQLFTEPYMVSFLLDNSLGAWWAAQRLNETDWKTAKSEEELRKKAAILGVPLEYLRFVKVEAASSRLKQIGYLHKGNDIANLSGNLPHWRQDSVTYFVTFRTADSLPQEKLNQWQAEKEAWLKQQPEPHDAQTRKEFYEKFPERLQRWLDQGFGECLLQKPNLRDIVEKALRHFDGERYDIDEFVVMPNHVHVVVTPKTDYQLSGILHSWRSFTANAINKETGKSGAFWQKESFDHIIRNPDQLEKIRGYIRDHSAYHGGSGILPLEEKRQSGSGFQPLEEKRQDAASTIWQPAAGTFAAWPDSLQEFKVLDPCCGSGHFLVAAFLMLVPMRMALEGLSAREAVDAVLRDNIHGLELDQRCVELAAFALALTAWRYPESGGYRPLPELHVACSGLSVSVAKEEWKQLALDKHNLRIALDWLHDSFKDAPVLGSLLNPARTDAAKIVEWNELSAALQQALNQEQTAEGQEAAVVAQGLTKAASLLAGKYHWVITNVPYLARGKQDERLRDFCEKQYPAAKNDLATVFLDRCLELCVEEPSRLFKQAAGSRFHSGTVSVVMPQNWLFLTSYKKFREKLLKNDTWHLIARLGPGAFETISGEVVKAILITLSRGQSRSGILPLLKQKSQDGSSTLISGLDVSGPRIARDKAVGLIIAEIKQVGQARQLENPDARVSFQEEAELVKLLIEYVDSYEGIGTGDLARFQMYWWESILSEDCLVPFRTTSEFTMEYSGYTGALLWESGKGEMVTKAREQNSRPTRGFRAWDKNGIAINRMRNLESSLFQGHKFDCNIAALIPKNIEHLAAIWAFCSSPEYPTLVRGIDQALKVTNHTLAKVPFDLPHWTAVAAQKYPHGLPKPYSDDPTQWIFHGHPCGSVVWSEEKKRLEAASTMRTDVTVLQVAVARLLGYRWPAELESGSGFQPLEDKRQDGASTIELSPEARVWVRKSADLLPLADEDGIVCIPSVRGEMAAADRLLNLLAVAWQSGSGILPLDNKRQDAASTLQDWLNQLLAHSDHASKSLETWVREKFFLQHCKLFQHRPFIWHIWDGLRDGFAALVNYHKLDYKTLETLIYTYLGDWITRQKEDIKNHVDGASEKLAAAEQLKKKLELILEGEAPYDIFVRWKPLAQQPIGWHPDLNDGVRLNIRPFMAAGVLRFNKKPQLNITWDKDRGKDVPSAPWFKLFKGDRINDHHLTLAEKRAGRG